MGLPLSVQLQEKHAEHRVQRFHNHALPITRCAASGRLPPPWDSVSSLQRMKGLTLT